MISMKEGVTNDDSGVGCSHVGTSLGRGRESLMTKTDIKVVARDTRGCAGRLIF